MGHCWTCVDLREPEGYAVQSAQKIVSLTRCNHHKTHNLVQTPKHVISKKKSMKLWISHLVPDKAEGRQYVPLVCVLPKRSFKVVFLSF